MHTRRLILIAVAVLCLSGCEEKATPSLLGPALLDPRARPATVHQILRRDARISHLARRDLATFVRETDEIHVLPYPTAENAAGYVVNLRTRIGADDLPLTAHHHDAFARGRLHLGRERALVPLRGHDAFLIRSDGTIPEGAYFLSLDSALVADLNGDGQPEIAKQSVVSLPLNGGSTVTMDVLRISKASDPYGTAAEAAFNPRASGTVPKDAWGWWAEDADADGVFSIHLGPVFHGKAEARVSLEWNASERVWQPKGIQPDTPCRYAPDSEEAPILFARKGGATEDLRDAVAAKHVSVPPPTERLKKRDPFWTWVQDIPVDAYSQPCQPGSLAGASHAALFAAMTQRRTLYQHLAPFWVKKANVPAAAQDDSATFARAIYLGLLDPEMSRARSIAFDTLDGATPPDAGDIILSFRPSLGCFSPYERHVTHLRCAPAGSFVSLSSAYAENSSRVPHVESQTAFAFWRADLGYEEARKILRTAWWLRRLHAWPLTSSGEPEVRALFPEDDGTFRVVAGADRFEISPGLDEERHRVFHAARWLLQAWLPEELGPRWEAASAGAFPHPARPAGAKMTRLRERAGQVLHDFIVAPHAPEAAIVALEACQEENWDALRVTVEAIRPAIPPPTQSELRLAAVEKEIAQWVREHGQEKAAESASRIRESARQNGGIAATDPLGIPTVPDPDPNGPAAPPPKIIPQADLDRFAPLDALYEERSALLVSKPPSEESFKELRLLSERAAKHLAAKDDPIALEAVANATRWPSDPSIRHLSAIDPPRALSLFQRRAQSDWAGDYLGLEESLAILRRKARQSDSSTEALALGFRPPQREDLPALFAFPPGSGHLAFRSFEGILRAFVPPAEPMRHDWPELDAALLELRARHPMTDALAAALIRRKLLRDWNPQMDSGHRALLAFLEPEQFQARFQRELLEHLANPGANADAIARAAWLCDLRELAPKLQPRATSRTEDLEHWGAGSRSHEVRWVLHLWHEPDAATRAKLLISYAIGSGFHPAETPEAWTRLLLQLKPALAEADANGRTSVSDFMRWLHSRLPSRGFQSHERARLDQVIAAIEATLPN